MSSKFHTEVRHYYIYAILTLDEMTAYVGKSYAKNPRSRFTAHLRGELTGTRDDFSPGAWAGDRPEFCILEAVDCTGAKAYQHIVAWCHYFEEQGFALLMPAGTCSYADHMLPSTVQIYEEVCAPFSLKEVLNREVPVQKEAAKPWTPELKQMNLRVREDVMEAFRLFCKEHGMTQSEGLRALLLQSGCAEGYGMVESVKRDMQRKDDEIAELKEENGKLRGKRDSGFYHCVKWADVVRELLDHILDKTEPTDTETEPLKANRFGESAKLFHAHQYPEMSGTCHLKVEAFIYGNSERGRKAALFVLGTTPDGRKIKLRWYPKKEFIGVYPHSRQYAYEGSEWLMGYIAAESGAVDLIAAIPVDMLPKKEKDNCPNIASERKSALDQQIFGAERRKRR